MGVSSLKVAWRRDRILDAAIAGDKNWRLCSRVVREVLNEPNSSIPLRYLEKRRDRLHLPITIPTFLKRNPLLFDLYRDRIKPTSEAVPFLRPSPRLTIFLEQERQIRSSCEELVVSKLSKLLMMSKNKAILTEKLLHVKRDFGFPDDILTNVILKFPDRFRLTGEFIELAEWDESLARSVVEERAIAESDRGGISVRPNFKIQLPGGFRLKKEMREWTRDWLELPYVSPYVDTGSLDRASPAMEKRMVAVLHEFLSLAVLRRAAVPTVGKFAEELQLSNAFPNAFSRHAGIFYVSLKGGIKTAVLREAYGSGGEIIDRDPMLKIKDLFVELLEEGHQLWLEQQRMKNKSSIEKRGDPERVIN
ncbi:ubiquitin carboxyl-terminal hydrolase family protein isoform X2 [Wolffia australiana]